MKATTVKVDGALLRDLERIKPRSLTLSAWVREILQREVKRQRMAEAADRYTEFVRDSPAETADLAEWDRADLTATPKRRRR